MTFEILKKKIFFNLLNFHKKGFFVVFISNIVSKFANMACQIFIVRFVSKYDYGIFVYSYNIYNFILLINGFCFSNSILLLCSEYNKNKNYSFSVFKYCVRIGTIFNFFIFGFTLAFAYFFTFKFESAKYQIMLLSALPIITFIYDCLCQFVKSRKKILLFSYISVLFSVTHCIFAIIGVKIFNIYGVIISYYFNYSIVLLILLFNILSEKYSTVLIKKEDIKYLWKVSFSALVGNTLSQALFLLDVFIIGLVTSNSQMLASYRVAITIPQSLIFIPYSIVPVIFPYFAENRFNISWLRNNYKKLMFFSIPMNLFISLFLFIFADFIISLFFGKEYLDAVPIFKIFAINYFFQATFRILSGEILASLRCYKFNLFNTIICGVLNVIFDYVLILKYGSMGAAIATALIIFLSAIVSTCYLINKLYLQ